MKLLICTTILYFIIILTIVLNKIKKLKFDVMFILLDHIYHLLNFFNRLLDYIKLKILELTIHIFNVCISDGVKYISKNTNLRLLMHNMECYL